MRVLLKCCVLCVWQFNLVISTGINLPFTSVAYKTSPLKPKSLSLSFSTNDSAKSKIPNNLEEVHFKQIKKPLSTQDEELSKKSVSVSRLLSKFGLISDNDSTEKNINFTKENQNVDPKILYEVSSPQKKLPNFKSNMNVKSNITKDQQKKKNTVNYNIKVISPPAVFNNFPMSLPNTHNAADNKMLYGLNKYTKNVPSISLASYPVRFTDESKQEPTLSWQNIKKSFSNSDYTTKEPRTEHDRHQIRNIMENEDITIPPKEISKFTADKNIHKIPFNIDSPSENVCELNNHLNPINVLDTAYCNNHNIFPSMADNIIVNQETTPFLHALNKHDAESNKINDNLISLNNIKDKPISKQFSVPNIPSNAPLSYVSKEPYTSDTLPPTLAKLSPPKTPEILKPQQIFTTGDDSYNFHLGSSLDNIISFLTSKLIFAFSNKNPLKKPSLSAPDLLQPHASQDTPIKLSETGKSLPVFVSSYPEVESPSYLPKPKVDVCIKNTDNAIEQTITRSPVPYISSVTINYMPSIESNEIIIFV